jgi:hypothetical protein
MRKSKMKITHHLSAMMRAGIQSMEMMGCRHMFITRGCQQGDSRPMTGKRQASLPINYSWPKYR